MPSAPAVRVVVPFGLTPYWPSFQAAILATETMAAWLGATSV